MFDDFTIFLNSLFYFLLLYFIPLVKITKFRTLNKCIFLHCPSLPLPFLYFWFSICSVHASIFSHSQLPKNAKIDLVVFMHMCLLSVSYLSFRSAPANRILQF